MIALAAKKKSTKIMSRKAMTMAKGTSSAQQRGRGNESESVSTRNAVGAMTTGVIAAATLWCIRDDEICRNTSSLGIKEAFAGMDLSLSAVKNGSVLRAPFGGHDPSIHHHSRKKIRAQKVTKEFNQEIPSNQMRDLEEKYQVDWVAVLGVGSYGAVHPGKLVDNGEKVAVKRMFKRSTDPSLLKSETEALFRIKDQGGHPNICALRDIYEDDEHFFLILDFVAGGEMLEHIMEQGIYSEEDASRLMREIASALSFLHEAGIVHSDVKPENLMLSSQERTEGKIKVIDFGCAVLDEASSGKMRAEEKENMVRECTGTSGTTAYWPPERFFEGAVADSASDMWSVGTILFTMLTGVHPFDVSGTSSDSEIEEAIKSDPTPPIGPDLTAHLSPSAVDLIQKLMAKEPSERLTANEMLNHPWILGKCVQA